VFCRLARHTRLDQDAGITRLLADHAEIRAAVQYLERRREKKIPIEAEAMAPREASFTITCVLKRKRSVFPAHRSLLGEEKLKRMGRGFTRLHPNGRMRHLKNGRETLSCCSRVLSQLKSGSRSFESRRALSSRRTRDGEASTEPVATARVA